MMSQVILHNYYRSSTSYRVRLALELKGIKYTYKPVNLLLGEQKTADYKKINPQGEVPTLEHNGHFIAQSFAIIEYLEEVFPQPALFPQDPVLKAKIRQFCENINSYLHPLSNLKVLQKLEADHGYDLALKEKWIAFWYHPGLAALEEIVSHQKTTYCFGDIPSAADIFLVPTLFTCRRFKVELTAYPNLCRIDEECQKLPAFQKAHPNQQPDFK